EIAEGVKEMFDKDIDRRTVEFPTPIKALGEHKATVRLHEDVFANLVVQVVASKASAKAGSTCCEARAVGDQAVEPRPDRRAARHERYESRRLVSSLIDATAQLRCATGNPTVSRGTVAATGLSG